MYAAKTLSFELTTVASGGAKYMQAVRKNIGDSALVVPGLGDEAFYNTTSYINTLIIRAGDAVYLIDVMMDPSLQLLPEDVQAKEKALAIQLFIQN